MLPGSKGKYLKIPVPYGYNIFHAIGQAADVAITQKRPLDAAAMVAGSFGDAFNPLGVAPTLLQTISPTAMRWLADLTVNQNFYGGPIKKEQKYGPKVAQSHLAFKGTSEVSKKMAQGITNMFGGGKYEPTALDISPDAMDYVAKQLTGGAGRQIGQVIDIGAKLGSGKASRIEPRNIPFVRRLYAEVDSYQDTRKFWDNIGQIEQRRAQYEHLKDVDPQKARDYYQKNRGILWFTERRTVVDREGRKRKMVRLNAMKKRFDKLRQEREMFDAKGMDDKVQEWDRQITAEAKRFNLAYKEAAKK